MLFKVYKTGENRDKLNQYLDTLEKDMLVEIKPCKRTNLQNSLLHSNIRRIANHMNLHIDEVKANIKDSITRAGKMRMMWEGTRKNGETFPVYRSTADLDKDEFSQFLEYVYYVGNFLGADMIYEMDVYGDGAVKEAEKVFNG